MKTKRINWQKIFIPLFVFLSINYFISCQKDEIPGRGRIGSKGGSVLSQDGKIKLNIPPGSISNNTMIHIIEYPDDDRYYIDGIGIGKKYFIEPFDLELSNPVTVEINYESEISKVNNPANLGVLQLGTYYDKVVNNISVSNDPESKKLTFSINHLSKLKLVEFNNQNAFFNFYWNIPVIWWYMEPPAGKSYLNEVNIQNALSLWENETSSFKFEKTSNKDSTNIIFNETHNKEGFKDLEINYHIHEETAGMMCFYFNNDLYNKTKLGEKDHIDIYIASDEINTSDENKSLNIAERILAHEVGHALGIAHTVQSSQEFKVMNESVTTADSWDGKLNIDDINALHENYSINQSFWGDIKIETLVDSLEYPHAIFLDNNKLYYTESAKRNTSFGGRSSLNFIDLLTNNVTVLHPWTDCTDAMVVIEEKIYCIPGGSGAMGVFDITQNKLTYLPYIDIATTDIGMDSNNNIYILGSSNNNSTKSLIKLSEPGYLNSKVLFSGLGQTISMSTFNNEIYYSGFLSTSSNYGYSTGYWGIWKIENFLTRSLFCKTNFCTGLAVSDNYIYYSDYQNNKIGKINKQSKITEILFDNIPNPYRMVFDKEKNTLYVLSHGTQEKKYKDGKVLKIANIE